jgi:hypothetical protein
MTNPLFKFGFSLHYNQLIGIALNSGIYIIKKWSLKILRQRKKILIFSIVVFIACNASGRDNDHYLEKEKWKSEALENILPFLTQHATDKSLGAFIQTWIVTGNLSVAP